MKSLTKQLTYLFENRHSAEAFDVLLKTMTFQALEYATRSSERNAGNPFLSSPKTVKAILDGDEDLFESVYFQLGNFSNLSHIIGEVDSYYSHCNVLPDLSHYFLSEENISSAIEMIDLKSVLKQFDWDALHHLFQRSLEENEYHLLNHPSVRYDIDKAAGRIWVQHFENEGRKRAYWLNTDKAPEVFNQLMNSEELLRIVNSLTNSYARCESLLCEELTLPQIVHDSRNWHIDKLADQIKVMIPIADIDERNGPMRYITNSTPEQLLESDSMRGHIHHCYIYSGMKTSVANFLPSKYIDGMTKHQEKSACAKNGEAIFFDTRCIHSGSACSHNQKRKTLTLTYKVNSLRNNTLESLPSFY